MNAKPPGRVLRDDWRVRLDTDDGGFSVAVVIDAASHGSPVLLGVEWIRPETEPVSWTADAETHEAYYVSSGHVRVEWLGPTAGDAVVGPEESFYFPPGHRYTVENVGDREAFIVWTVTPSPPPAAP
jgi:mannose-6-phosphate isomerase-like protein (cupin superfamily)